jgi:glycogen operon protein
VCLSHDYHQRVENAGGKSMRVWLGRPYPLGATWDGGGVNFALFSENATRVELCLFNGPEPGARERRVGLTECTDRVWHAYLPDVLPGQLYGFRVSGPYEPESGHRFNPNKLLLDPYAKLVGRQIRWDDSLFGYPIGADDLKLCEKDSAAFAPLGTVVDTSFTWGDDGPPQTPWHRTVVYECHVKGFTKKMPGVPDDLRGTYAGLASDAAVSHLLDLGVTAVELLPVHHRADDRHLQERGLSNYWGYNTLAFFAPDTRFALRPEQAVTEFKTMVRRLHAAGIEVILDVVYNHTAEGNQLGPTLSWKGADNKSYYHLSPENPRYYMDFTGCGNTPNTRHPRVLQLMMDSLRYWVQEMHVDGFRFDLATALARELFEVDQLGAFFDIIHQDPVLSRVKLIAEPLDVGPGGYQVGNFPVLWSEWNGEYRDSVRRFWAGRPVKASVLAHRLCGSGDLYEPSGRHPHASINFVTCHDGFTLADLVSYERKRNEANGEDNRDGSEHNDSWNGGVEGPTDDPAVQAVRLRQQRNLLATLFLSQGVPMLLAGDEVGHTQNGNNNTYCQDNDLTWIDWEPTPERRGQMAFVRKLAALRKEHPVLRRRKFYQGRPLRGEGIQDVNWFDPAGQDMNDGEWEDEAACLGMRLAGDRMDETDEYGRPVAGETLFVMLNAGREPRPFQLPPTNPEHLWEVVLDTANDDPLPQVWAGGSEYPLQAHTLAVFVTRPRPDGGMA